MQYNFNLIPEEMKGYNQWCVWSYEDIGAKKPTKVPYYAKDKYCAVDNPNTWLSFQDANSLFNRGAYSGIGFIFTDNDPFTFIDLDNTEGDVASYERQLKIYREFDSYSEISPSGKGLHIITRGFVPNGRRRSFIEVYSNLRYATMTGVVYNDKPITENQNALTQLWDQMGASGIVNQNFHGTEQETSSDDEIIEQASNAVNGQKFVILLRGDWTSLYNSQSEADYAFIDIVAFYTQNKKQIERIFLSSQLGQRKKAKRTDYINGMINKSFDRMLPPIDFDGFKNALEDKIKKTKPPPVENLPAVVTVPKINNSGVAMPPGLLGELCQFIYAAAPRSVPEVALAGAIGLLAGITGRAYNISGTGLNQYILLIANTGSGKEAISSGIDRLMNAIRMQVPTSTGFIGPSEIASGQALVKFLAKNSQCFVSILGEFGLRLQSMSSQNANGAELSLRRMLLDLYNKSGYGQTFRASIYADSEKNIAATEAPAFSICGESTPEKFYGALNEDMISEGLLPRFMIVEYTGPRPHSNKDHKNAVPSFQLVDRLAQLAANCEVIMHSKKVINIELNAQAQQIADSFDRFADDQINTTNKEVLRQLWNRAHMKVLKLAGLIAVGSNMFQPVVTEEFIHYAIDMVQNDIRSLSAKFERGEIGLNTFENKQQAELVKIINEYYKKEWDDIKKYSKGKNGGTLYNAKIVTYDYIHRRCIGQSAFKNDKMGATYALKKTIQNLIDTDILREIGRPELTMKYGTTQRAFVLSNVGILD